MVFNEAYLGSAKIFSKPNRNGIEQETPFRATPYSLEAIRTWFWERWRTLIRASPSNNNEVDIVLEDDEVSRGDDHSNQLAISQLDGQEFWVKCSNGGDCVGHLLVVRTTEMEAAAPAHGSSVSKPQRSVSIQADFRDSAETRRDRRAESETVASLKRDVVRLESELKEVRAKNAKLESDNSVLLETMIQQSIKAQAEPPRNSLPCMKCSNDSNANSARSGSASSTNSNASAVATRSNAKRGKHKQKSSRTSSPAAAANSSHDASNNQHLFSQSDGAPKNAAEPEEQFLPVGLRWQNANIVQFRAWGSVFYNGCIQRPGFVRLGRPLSVRHIIGDGNCFFRSISYVLTGSEEYHGDIREGLVQWMRRNSAIMRSLIDDMSAYLRRERMASWGTWATQFEISALATMLQTKVYVCSWEPYSGYDWKKYIPLAQLAATAEFNNESIYLVGGFAHFDVVLDVI